MLQSMTGFGRAEQAVGDKVFLAEVKSLNGKQFDLRITIPTLLKPFEFDIRNILQEKLVRGSVECIIYLKQNGSSKPVTINKELARAYYEPISELSDELGLNPGDILSALLKLPEVITPTNEVLTDEEWTGFEQVLIGAVNQLKEHRADEGKSLEEELLLRIENILSHAQKIAHLEPMRQQRIRDGLIKTLEDNVGKDNYDSNRLEQELIYYIEKIDITEEQVRLHNHCNYFKSILKEPEEGKGKKLSFIMQEVGREINTTGSKAYDSEMQKSVVLMKDELEKAKEQVLNVL
ncbi:MAG: Protein YicC [uncultured Segetibacter sp.]|uniref:Protein YicC n=1 Tax=uncultured Segetibacter sp. TaxID=481133 RepID=A0A6J4SGR9_9BACT|nr:MAG: Protein YicC [uncultured Segetibacter sp.]